MNSKRKILVVCYDAGGSELIAGYLRTHPAVQFEAYVAGPASKVFRRNGLSFHKLVPEREAITKVMSTHTDAPYALIGTGEMTKAELYAIQEARCAGIKSIVYLDSWVNYRGRFGYPRSDWQDNLPDEIWSGDVAGRRLAQEAFPGLKIRIVPNQYFQDIAREYEHSRRVATEVLFFGTSTDGSPETFERMLAGLAENGKAYAVCVRLHPAESVTRYDDIIKRYKPTVRIRKSRAKDIVTDLAHAQIAVGLETMALALAHKVGIPAICIVPDGGEMTLPFARIRRADSGESAARLIVLLSGKTDSRPR